MDNSYSKKGGGYQGSEPPDDYELPSMPGSVAPASKVERQKMSHPVFVVTKRQYDYLVSERSKNE